MSDSLDAHLILSGLLFAIGSFASWPGATRSAC